MTFPNSYCPPIDSFLDQDGQEGTRKEGTTRQRCDLDIQDLQTLSEYPYIDTRSSIDMEIPLAIRDRSNAQQSFEGGPGRVERASTRDTLLLPTPNVRVIRRG